MPSHEIPRTSPSAIEPSSLHIDIGLATTIQLPPFISGQTACGGVFHAVRGCQKQNAAPAQSVSVGVTYIRREFIKEVVHRLQPAPLARDGLPHAAPLLAPQTRPYILAPIRLAGNTLGKPNVHGDFQQLNVTNWQVSAEKTGFPVDGVRLESG